MCSTRSQATRFFEYLGMESVSEAVRTTQSHINCRKTQDDQYIQEKRNAHLSPLIARTPAITSLCPAMNFVAECITISVHGTQYEFLIRLPCSKYYSHTFKHNSWIQSLVSPLTTSRACILHLLKNNDTSTKAGCLHARFLTCAKI